ncbi:guanine-1-methyltransferase-domain-containing protein [Triangularia verruculosa]|uniref:tRNA (guanine(9)-N1)-methyltransferase n=1 Tax=Triangularia verruculosa TaxID=2587418 RepID=A0AAN6XDU9_9PEZI|nr:guanine-1-methyltransferase-domain-containing protein [Triangularia verruculosa]
MAAVPDPQTATVNVDKTGPPTVHGDANSFSTANSKRKADTDVSELDERTVKKSTPSVNDDEQSPDTAGSNGEKSMAPTQNENQTSTPVDASTTEEAEPGPSKRELRKLRKQQAYEAYAEHRKQKRKDKRHEKQAQRREEKEELMAKAIEQGLDPMALIPTKKQVNAINLPISIVIDCDFEQYMREGELISLASQLTRSYAMNRKEQYQPHLSFSGFSGQLKERFETKLKNTHLNWRNIVITEDNFVDCAKRVINDFDHPYTSYKLPDHVVPVELGNIPHMTLDENFDNKSTEGIQEDSVHKNIVYLTSDSPYTLDRLEPGTSYIIGGLVDRNREKGLCYKRAQEYKVRHAKLPIGDFMAMQSRFVLTTNQVVEIMAKWLQCGNWGQAFIEVIPKRKGGVLKGGGGSEAGGDDEEVGEEKPTKAEDDSKVGDVEKNEESEPTTQAAEVKSGTD